MKAKVLIITAILLSSGLFSQSLQWAFNMAQPFNGMTPGAAYPRPSVRSVTTDSDNNVLVTGVFHQYIDLDPGPDSAIFTSSSFNCFVAKYSEQGEYLWGFAMDSSYIYGNVIRCDKDDNVYVAGQFHYADFDPSTDTFFLSSPYSMAMFIAKYSPSGEFIHAIRIGSGINPLLYSNNLVDFRIDESGNLYCVGRLIDYPSDFNPSGDSLILQSGSGEDEIFIAKYTRELSLLWAKRIGSNGTSGYQWAECLALDNAGMFYIGGMFSRDSVDFDPSPTTSYYLKPWLLPYDINTAFFAKYDTSGTFKWARKMDSPELCITQTLSPCSNGDILVSGCFNQSIILNPLVTTSNTFYSAAGSSDANSFIARFTSNGDFLWGRPTLASDNVYQVSTVDDISGNIIVAGNFLETLFPWGLNQSPYIVSKGKDMFIATYSSSGQLLSIQSLGADSSGFNVRVIHTNQGGVIVGGQIGGYIDLDPGQGTHILNGSIGQAFLAKYTLNTGVETHLEHTEYHVFPNPTSDYLNILVKNDKLLSKGKLHIYNLQGALLLEYSIRGHQEVMQCNLSHLPAGIYIGRINSSSGESEVFRFVKGN